MFNFSFYPTYQIEHQSKFSLSNMHNLFKYKDATYNHLHNPKNRYKSKWPTLKNKKNTSASIRNASGSNFRAFEAPRDNSQHHDSHTDILYTRILYYVFPIPIVVLLIFDRIWSRHRLLTGHRRNRFATMTKCYIWRDEKKIYYIYIDSLHNECTVLMISTAVKC